jgi:Calx-beta domain
MTQEGHWGPGVCDGMRRSLSLALAVAASAAVLVPAAAQADGTKRTAAGANPASIQPAIDAFRVDLGGTNNLGGPPAASGRREVNWDGVPDTAADPNPFPGGFFLGRGLQLDTSGTGFQVSAKAASGTPVRFNNPEFQAFSQERLFSPIGSTTYDSHFFVPGTATPATTSGFGAVFADVDTAGSAKIEYFDPAGALIDTVVVPPSPNGGLSFAGESFDAGERVGRVRVTSGTTTTLTADGGADAVVQDDFLYGEPQPGLIALQSGDVSVEEDAGKAVLTVTRTGANAGAASVAFATADGTAKAAKDYTARTGTVMFALGETLKRIEIPVTADTKREGDESYTIALSNASGAALAAPRVATVTIHDRTSRVRASLHRLVGLRFVLVAHIDGSYRAKLALSRSQATKAGLSKRTLISTGSRSLREGGTVVSLRLGKGVRAKLHKAKVKPTLTITLSDGSTLHTRIAL